MNDLSRRAFLQRSGLGALTVPLVSELGSRGRGAEELGAGLPAPGARETKAPGTGSASAAMPSMIGAFGA
ncbi:MAG: twin-arginine translocation signal domain-containing protein, partial [Rhodothermales bacterium]